MKHKISLLLIITICLMPLLPASAETLRFYRTINKHSEGFQSFTRAHPEVQCVWSDNEIHDYSTTVALNGALITREFNFDIFSLTNTFFDCQQIMSKGYCTDLSDSEVIRKELEKMHPSIAAQAMRDGRIYAVPQTIGFDYWLCDEKGWEAAGLTKSDVPGTFPEFLDFLESWVARTAKDPEHSVSVMNMWDETLYNEHSYANWLVGLLMENYIMQREYAGEPLLFDNPELISLLGRAKDIGHAIYQTEPIGKQGTYGLFERNGTGSFRGNVPSMFLSLRMNANQPKLLCARLDMLAINAASEKKALALELMERILSEAKGRAVFGILLYKDAEPLKSEGFDDTLARYSKNISDLEERLKAPKLDAAARDSLEADLIKLQKRLEDSMQWEYTISPEDLQAFKAFADTLYFPVPGIFFIATEEGRNMKELEERFAAGNLSAKEFVKQMDRIAQMVALENGQ